jgi:exodeoxyribonuclease-3
MRLLTLNIRQGGSSRCQQLCDAIAAHEPDLVVLTEFRQNRSGEKIRSGLCEEGLAHQFSPSVSEPKVNTVLIAGRARFEFQEYPELDGDQHRVVLATGSDLTVAGVYFAQKEAKRSLFEFLLAQSADWLQGPAIIIGDWNTGRHREDEPTASFYCADCFDALLDAGWIDAWRSRNVESREYSWYSNVGNGFRIDHALVSPMLDTLIRDVRYSHHERLERWTDHSALIVDVAITETR